MLFLLALACSTPAPVATEVAAAPEKVEPHEAHEGHEAALKVALGKAPDEALAVSIDDVIAKAAEFEGKVVVVKAQVAAVCQKKGCWHRLGTANPDVTVMVKDKEYEVFLPLGATGKSAIVSGIFHTETLGVDEAKHYAEDAGKDPATVTGPVTQFAIDVDGVKLM